ncbi:hypothetical protein CYLTODRAFT_423893 [Cylindrobasidium torrendii FP15055 ss-10]|uniref:Uncharacterized protein n=1 Tax=Cylindrobasidium torrendii FP15055 ss-10 TaxID=1314674 RepID=A0A0D7B8W3_9AGAR|nr:hypothetical protein CYLTODRAFT_423893 [Cylindrobasidium torrendii FP15055 ss-10]
MNIAPPPKAKFDTSYLVALVCTLGLVALVFAIYVFLYKRLTQQEEAKIERRKSFAPPLMTNVKSSRTTVVSAAPSKLSTPRSSPPKPFTTSEISKPMPVYPSSNSLGQDYGPGFGFGLSDSVLQDIAEKEALGMRNATSASPSIRISATAPMLSLSSLDMDASRSFALEMKKSVSGRSDDTLVSSHT